MRSNKCINSTSGRKYLTENRFSDINFRRCFLLVLVILLPIASFDHMITTSGFKSDVIFQYSAPVFPKVDYVTFGNLLSPIRLSVVCLSVMFVRLAHGLNHGDEIWVCPPVATCLRCCSTSAVNIITITACMHVIKCKHETRKQGQSCKQFTTNWSQMIARYNKMFWI